MRVKRYALDLPLTACRFSSGSSPHCASPPHRNRRRSASRPKSITWRSVRSSPMSRVALSARSPRTIFRFSKMAGPRRWPAFRWSISPFSAFLRPLSDLQPIEPDVSTNAGGLAGPAVPDRPRRSAHRSAAHGTREGRCAPLHRAEPRRQRSRGRRHDKRAVRGRSGFHVEPAPPARGGRHVCRAEAQIRSPGKARQLPAGDGSHRSGSRTAGESP